jgi:hypothetical protein
MRPLAIIAIVLTSCSTGGSVRDTFYHTPLASSEWRALTPRQTPGSGKPGNSDRRRDRDDGDIRARMIAEAEALLAQAGEGSGYGAEDLQTILEKVRGRLGWRSDQGLDALVSLGKKNGAYRLDDEPAPGDIALFHNQVDANMNGELDDWLTGCGVVTRRDGPRFEAVVRTGNAPRQVIVWPDDPSRRTANGKTVNSYLRIPSRSDPAGTAYLAGRLYAGYLDIEQLVGDTGD